MALWDILVSIFWFMVLFAWIWLLIMILNDIFRDRELSGWAKALWTLFLIVLPWLGALVADELVRLAVLRDRGAISAEDYDRPGGGDARSGDGEHRSTMSSACRAVLLGSQRRAFG